MKNQKFHHGDVVHIAKDLGPSMFHFEADKDAIVLYSYRDKYGGDNTHDYGLLLLPEGHEVSWYHEQQLTFIRPGGEDEIQKVYFLKAKRDAMEMDIHWIMANWLSIRKHPSGATMGALMRLIGITNPWPHGEGWELYENQMGTLRLLDPVLSTGDYAKLNACLTKLGQPAVELP